MSRSQIMSRIRSKDTVSEVLLRKTLWHLKIRYRKNYIKLPGKPDIVIPKYRLVIFIDGEFWHGHNWDVKKEKIKDNRDFWIAKIERNMKRDVENNQALKNAGWNVIRFWDNEIKSELGACLKKILNYMT